MELKKILNTVVSTDYSAFFYTPDFYDKSFSLLFVDPVESITINSIRSLDKKLKQIDQLIDEGYSAYALIKYEAGYLFEKNLLPLLKNKNDLIQFFFCNPKDVIKFESSSLSIPDYDKLDFKIRNFRLNCTKTEFIRNINRIKKYIKLGDTYQVNYTVKGKFSFLGDIGDLFIKLLFNQSAEYTSIINYKNDFILSFSPELFFRIDGKKIITKPMKGTARRGFDLQSDNMIRYNLSMSDKNRAENVMIVDLLRNDLGRISKYGSVQVEKIFEVEKYESLYQMISEVSSKLNKGVTFTDILKNIFPCGSITGAPKIRTMEIINEMESESRGIYTGSIGFIHKRKKVFNVSIRTLVINKKTARGEIGLGSGIVWDSVAGLEFKETVLKSRFLTKPEKEFRLFETMLLENGEILLLEEHLKRLQLSASFMLFKFDQKKISKEIKKKISIMDDQSKQKIKLYLNKWGKVKLEIKPFVSLPEEINVIISKSRISTSNRYQYFKTTNRILYDREYKFFSKKGFFDVIYFNEKNELAEGSITNIFLKIDDTWFTPPLTSGILAGVYRKYMLQHSANIKEKTLFFEDLMAADEIILANSLKREIKVNNLYLNETEFRTLQ